MVKASRLHENSCKGVLASKSTDIIYHDSQVEIL